VKLIINKNSMIDPKARTFFSERSSAGRGMNTNQMSNAIYRVKSHVKLKDEELPFTNTYKKFKPPLQ